MGQAHVAHHQRGAETLLQTGIAPVRSLTIQASQRHVEGEQAQKTGLAEGSEATDQHRTLPWAGRPGGGGRSAGHPGLGYRVGNGTLAGSPIFPSQR